MSSSKSRINELKDSYQGNSHSHKRKRRLRKQKKSKSDRRVSLTTSFHAGNEGNSLDMIPRIIGDDGHYYECIVCDSEGNLLCCDNCPNTYHLDCLSPPLESVPAGNWQCPNCLEEAELQIPLSALLMLKKKASTPKSSVGVLNSLPEPEGLGSEKCVIGHDEQINGITKESENPSASKGIKVYTRRARKCNGSIILTEVVPQALDNDTNASMQEEPEAQAMNTSDSAQAPNADQADKLLILRDTMDSLMNIQPSVQSKRQESNEAKTPRRSETPKEKFARLRERQKQKIALRNRASPVIPGARTIGREPLVLLKPHPLSYISAPAENLLFNPLNSCKSLSILRDLRRFFWHQDSEPALSWQQRSYAGPMRPSSASSSTVDSDNLVSTELTLNSLSPSQHQKPADQGRKETQNLFLGGLISISKAKLDLLGGAD